MRNPAGAVLIAAAAVLAAASGIILPAPTRGLLPLSVGAPELSAWLLVAAVVVLLVSTRLLRSWPGRLSLIASAIAGVLATLPLAQVPRATRSIDHQLGAAFGADYADRVDPGARARWRVEAVSARELFAAAAQNSITPPTDLTIASPGNARLSVRIYRPGMPGSPVVVQIYGGAWQRGEPADDPTLAGYLAARGYAVFAVDYRHAPRWRWPMQLEDVRSGLSWVREHAQEYGGDAARMAIVGRSSGAHLALMAAYRALVPDIRGVISLYGPTDLTRGYRELPRPDPIDVRGTLEALTGGTPDSLPQVYEKASPIAYASSRQPPTLQIIGARDHIVLPRFAASLDGRLRAAGNASILIELPWADHAFDAVTFGPSAQLTRYAVERFLAVTLHGR